MSALVYVGEDLSNPDFSFDKDTIMDINVDTAVNLVMDEMTADTAEVTVRYEETNQALQNLTWGTPVYIFNGEVPIGKFLLKRVVRTGEKTYVLECTSLVGLLEYDTYYGGMFTGETFQEVVENIIATNGMTSFLGAAPTIRRTLTDPDNPNFDPAFHDTGINIGYGGGVGYSLLRATVTINRSLLSEVDVPSLANATTCRDVILGVACDPSITSSSTLRQRCGLYMDLTRASVNDPWPEYGPVYFAFGDNVASLGTPTEPTSYVIFTHGSFFSVNGTTYRVNNAPNVSNRWPQHYLGGLLITNDSLDTVNSSYPHDVLYQRYEIATLNGKFSFDGIAYKTKSGDLIPGSGADGSYTLNAPIANAVAASYVSFQSEAEYQNEILSSIQYADGIESLPIYGWMPVCTKREALHQLLFSQGVILRKSEVGDLLFTAPTTKYYDEISSNRIYNDGSEEYAEHTNSVIVTEHAYPYDSEDATATLYSQKDNSIVGALINFNDAPVYYKKESISSIEASTNETSGISHIRFYVGNCNSAVVGKTFLTVNTEDFYGCIKGTHYTQEEKSIIRQIGNYPDGKDALVSDATLVTAYNSETVAVRLESYYGEAHTVKNSIVLSEENNGGYYKFVSPFKDNVYGFLKKQTLSFSSNVKANCEFIVNYNPPQIGTGFENFVLLTGSGTWTVPESVLNSDNPRIRIVLIGGGQGGESGYAGQNGVSAARNASSTEKALGGDPGASGESGNVYEITIDNPASSYTYSAGVGGAGGAISTSHDSNNAGSYGTDSTVNDGTNYYSSAYGRPLTAGYLNFITNEIYAGKFKFYKWGYLLEIDIPITGGTLRQGIGYGGDGGYYGWSTPIGSQTTYLAQNPGTSATYYYGLTDDDYVVNGEHGTYGLHYPRSGSITSSAGMAGGGGVGAKGSTTANGGNGGNAPASGGKAGNGGNGGNATWIPPKATDFNPSYYGYGGLGGGGGGAGGSSGWTRSGTTGTGGTGGYGGVGGAGGDGCILIYY